MLRAKCELTPSCAWYIVTAALLRTTHRALMVHGMPPTCIIPPLVAAAGIISTATAPFGGIKASGFGREGSRIGLDEYTYVKYVMMGV